MDNPIFTKTYGIFSIIYCSIISLIALVTILLPINSWRILPYESKGIFFYYNFIAILTILAFTPQPIALISFYFSGGIGKSWFSHIGFGGIVITLIGILLLIAYVVFSQLTGGSNPTLNNKNQLYILALPIGILTFLNVLVFPIAFTIMALVAQKVSLWQRFLPIISLVLSILFAIIGAIIIVLIGTLTKIEIIYQGAKEATFPHWFMVGSIAWALLSLIAFLKANKKINYGNQYLPPLPNESY